MCALTRSDLQRIFEKVDVNGDGFLSLEELKMVLEKTGFKYSVEELECLVGKKRLELSEFLVFYECMVKQKNGEEEGGDEIEDVERDLVKTFKVFDLDGDGFITSQELECVLKRLGMWDERCGKDSTSMICSYDTNFDGKLDFQEFKDMMLLTNS
ncbi:probable calcium-binding protein CML44 [Vigna unguiculata]|uniref:Calcium-binding protein CML n=1 Tax=Vigna unguiculata TaxID=3917 RepID=A0A4D6MFM7_VIGUN|nr:probable calcium-binding protein CML44 [Vigna unguiculata]QCD99817.1 calcium-binding protein CML [Vigna unguiculata]